MISLDLRSVVLVAALLGASMGVVLLGVRRNYPANIPGLLLWGLAPLLCGAAALTYSLEGVVPPALAALGGHALLLAGEVLFLMGSQRFLGVRTHGRLWALLCVADLLLLAWFYLVQPDYRVRMLLLGGLRTAILATHLVVLLRWARGFAGTFMAAVVAAQLLTLVARTIAVVWVYSAHSQRFDASLVQSVYLLVSVFSLMLLSIGCQFMASERVRDEFKYLATHDDLTGAMARRTVIEASRQELSRWQRYGEPLSLLLLDVDHFKRINDGHGHQAGDQVLTELVQVLRCSVRQVDLLGRYGGEEFIVLLPATNLAAACQLAERMRHAVAEHGFEAAPQGVTVSIGVSSVMAGDACVEARSSRADAALYLAKRDGRNLVRDQTQH